jgi:lipocalin-like protein
MAAVRDAFEGTWRLLSRIDRAADGTPRDEPTLGSNPVAMITYAAGTFAAQFMKRDRSSAVTLAAGVNNTGAVGGYDAYFGTYTVREDGLVEHHLVAALTPANVGMTVLRRLRTEGGRLVIALDTSAANGEAVTRTLTWERIA